MQNSNKRILQKIISEIDMGYAFIGDMTKEDFLKSELVKRAIGMVIINVGEFVKNLTLEFRTENPHIVWSDIEGLGDTAACRYETLRMDDLYTAIKEEFPEIKIQIEKILESDENAD